MKNVKISVVVVCKNESNESIKTTLSSIIQQTYTNIELILIDGNSESSTQNALNEYKYHFSVFVSENDESIFDAMNKGIYYSTGEWVIFMNIGDSFYSSTVLDEIVNFINHKKGNQDIIYGDANHLDGLGLRRAPAFINKYSLYVRGICHQAMLTKKSCFSKVGLYDTSHIIVGDPDWNLKAYIDGMKFMNSGLVICNYAGNESFPESSYEI